MTARTHGPVGRIAIVAAVVFAGAAFLATGAAAGEASSAAAESTGHVAPGTSGLIFLVEQNLTLGAFDGAAISYRRSRWRYGLSLNGSYHRDSQHIDGPGFATDFATFSQAIGGQLTAQRIGEHPAGHGVSGYWAVGPTAGISRSRSWRDGTRSEDRIAGWNAGLLASVGAEYPIADRVSLLGEYGIAASYSWSRNDVLGPDPDRRIERSRSFTIDARAVRLGLTAWFR